MTNQIVLRSTKGDAKMFPISLFRDERRRWRAEVVIAASTQWRASHVGIPGESPNDVVEQLAWAISKFETETESRIAVRWEPDYVILECDDVALIPERTAP